jgi:hypothetical protein
MCTFSSTHFKLAEQPSVGTGAGAVAVTACLLAY